MGVELGCWWPSSTHPFPICPASFNALCRVRFPVGFRFGKRPKRETTLLISEWRMPFLTCCSHVFPLTFANGPVFWETDPEATVIDLQRSSTIDLIYPEEFERTVGRGVAQNVVCASLAVTGKRGGERCQETLMQRIPRH